MFFVEDVLYEALNCWRQGPFFGFLALTPSRPPPAAGAPHVAVELPPRPAQPDAPRGCARRGAARADDGGPQDDPVEVSPITPALEDVARSLAPNKLRLAVSRLWGARRAHSKPVSSIRSFECLSTGLSQKTL